MSFKVAVSKMKKKRYKVSRPTVDPGGVWWSWNIFDGGPVVSSMQSINHRGHRDSHSCLPEVVVIHEVGNPLEDMISYLYSRDRARLVTNCTLPSRHVMSYGAKQTILITTNGRRPVNALVRW